MFSFLLEQCNNRTVTSSIALFFTFSDAILLLWSVLKAMFSSNQSNFPVMCNSKRKWIISDYYTKSNYNALTKSYTQRRCCRVQIDWELEMRLYQTKTTIINVEKCGWLYHHNNAYSKGRKLAGSIWGTNPKSEKNLVVILHAKINFWTTAVLWQGVTHKLGIGKEIFHKTVAWRN